MLSVFGLSGGCNHSLSLSPLTLSHVIHLTLFPLVINGSRKLLVNIVHIGLLVFISVPQSNKKTLPNYVASFNYKTRIKITKNWFSFLVQSLQ